MAALTIAPKNSAGQRWPYHWTVDYCLSATPAINHINNDKAKHEIYSMVLRKNKLRTNLFHKKQIFFEKITISLYIMHIQA